MNILAVIILSVALSFSSDEKRIQHLYEDPVIRCQYETLEGRLDGHYISYYSNGRKKSEGYFENNYRSGTWTVWDTTGRLRMQRTYSDPFTFTRHIPAMPDDAPVKLLHTTHSAIHYDEKGFIRSFHLDESMLVWAQRVWRYITPADNPLLFDRDVLFRVIDSNIRTKNITPYSSRNDEFRIIADTIPDVAHYRITGYRIKEDSFFDRERMVSETRIIGICPVAIDLISNDTTDLYWIYFPQLRKCLARETIKGPSIPEKIRTLDDLFFYRYFSSEIYKTDNQADLQISDYKQGKDIRKEAERMEIGLIESEHDLWISFTE